MINVLSPSDTLASRKGRCSHGAPLSASLGLRAIATLTKIKAADYTTLRHSAAIKHRFPSHVFHPTSFLFPDNYWRTHIGSTREPQFRRPIRRDDEWMEAVLEVHCDIILRFVTPTMAATAIVFSGIVILK